MLCIAHRIHTVMGCDMVAVMNGGKLVEYGQPQELLKDPTSQFYSAYEGAKGAA